MDRKTKKALTRRFGHASGNLNIILEKLKAGNLRVHPFETKLEHAIKTVDDLFIEFVESYPEER